MQEMCQLLEKERLYKANILKPDSKERLVVRERRIRVSFELF